MIIYYYYYSLILIQIKGHGTCNLAPHVIEKSVVPTVDTVLPVVLEEQCLLTVCCDLVQV